MISLIFKHLTSEHLEWARQLHNDPSVICMLTDPHIVTKEEQVKWFNKLQHSTSSQRLVVYNNEVPAGLIRLDDIDMYNKSICVGLDIHEDFRGRGLARPIYTKLFDIWFNDEGFNRIWLAVAEYNEVARHIYTSLGFIEEGCMRKALLKDNKFSDYILMSVLKEEYDCFHL